MRRLLLIALVVTALVLVASCSVKVEGEVGGDKPPAPEAEREITPEQMDAGDEEGIEVVTIVIGDERSASGDITNETTEFAPDTAVMYVTVAIKGLETGATITGTLNAIKVTTPSGETVEDYEVVTTDVEAPGSEATANFEFSAPDAGWPVGDYEAVISVDDEVVKTVAVTVAGADA